MNATPLRSWFTCLAVRPMLAETAPLPFRPSISSRGFCPGTAPFRVPTKRNSSEAIWLAGEQAENFTAVGRHHVSAMKDVVGLVRGCHQLGASGQAHRRADFSNEQSFDLPRFAGKRESGAETVWSLESRGFETPRVLRDTTFLRFAVRHVLMWKLERYKREEI